MFDRMMACGVAICVLWHAAVGCCAHHERCVSHASQAAAPNCGHHGSHHDDHDCDRSDSGHEEHAPADCTEASCVMTATAESRVQAAPDDGATWLVPLAVDGSHGLTLAATVRSVHSNTGVLRPGPMRTHLALRVLLI